MTSRNSVCFTYSSLSTYTHSHAFFKWQETSLLLLYVLIWVHMICFGIANCVVDYGWTGPFGFDIWIGTRVVVAWQTYCSASLCGYLEVSCNLFISSDWKPDFSETWVNLQFLPFLWTKVCIDIFTPCLFSNWFKSFKVATNGVSSE